jgi:hypothetical protein
MTHSHFNIGDIRQKFPLIQTLGELFKAFENEFVIRGEVICQFKVNGMSLSENDEKKFAEIQINDIEIIDIDSESPAALLFELLNNWMSELPALIQSTDQLAKEIKFNGIDGNLKAFVDLVDSCQFLIESLINLEKIIYREAFQLEKWRHNEELTARAISEALAAFEKKDFVLLAEILEYDLAHSLQIWAEEIRSVDGRLKAENDKDSRHFSDRIFNKSTTETR